MEKFQYLSINPIVSITLISSSPGEAMQPTLADRNFPSFLELWKVIQGSITFRPYTDPLDLFLNLCHCEDFMKKKCKYV